MKQNKILLTGTLMLTLMGYSVGSNAVEVYVAPSDYQAYTPPADDTVSTSEAVVSKAKSSVTKVVKATSADGMVSDIGMSAVEREATTPKGKLKNPFTDDPKMAIIGHKRFMGAGCNGCHGGTGGGGMCPPLTNEVFVYGSDDDTLFRLITLGSMGLQKKGYFRKGMEGVVGPMPAHGDIVKTDETLWSIIAWIRTVYQGDPKRRNW